MTFEAGDLTYNADPGNTGQLESTDHLRGYSGSSADKRSRPSNSMEADVLPCPGTCSAPRRWWPPPAVQNNSTPQDEWGKLSELACWGHRIGIQGPDKSDSARDVKNMASQAIRLPLVR